MTMSRRSFLRGSSGSLAFAAAATTLSRWVGEADAATLAGYPGYRAAVCVFLLGGNDGNNVLVPTATNANGTGALDHYRRVRPNIAIDPSQNLINPVGLAAGSYGLHPALAKLKGHFEASRAALVCNVGPLVLPTNKALYGTPGHDRPYNLFSHSDQQDAWASAIANPLQITLPAALIGKGPTGWGGRMADKITSLNTAAAGYPEVTTFGGRGLFANGAARKPLVVSSGGTLAFNSSGDANLNALRQSTLGVILPITNGVTLEQAYGSVYTTASTYAGKRDAARTAAWAALSQPTRDAIDALFTTGVQTGWTLPGQLYQVIRDLVAGATAAPTGVGLKREVFSVGFGTFDTHADQDVDQAKKLAELDFALDAFQQAMDLLATAMGPNGPQATLFTMSDFGRTLQENSDKGTDHAWGSHMIVLGRQVDGKKLYGRFPNLDLTSGGANNPDTVDGKGRFIPAVSVEQYANTIATWLGLTLSSERAYLFPNLAGYVAAAADTTVWPALARSYRLGFMRADPPPP